MEQSVTYRVAARLTDIAISTLDVVQLYASHHKSCVQLHSMALNRLGEMKLILSSSLQMKSPVLG